MQFPNFDPVFLRIGPFQFGSHLLGPLEFRWYGLMYILGFIAAYFIIRAGVKKKQLPLTKDDVADLIFTVALGVILGGRLGYILFYDLQVYLARPLEIFAVWHGGMSFHGGLLGAIAAGFYYIRKKGIGFYQIADIGFMAAPVGLCLGRLGNFINGELYGRATSVPWGVIFPGGGNLPRHPSQLYEAILEGPLMFSILWLVGRRKHPAGIVFWSFIGLYGLFRFIVEFFREPDAQLGFIVGRFSMGQMLSLPMALLGSGMIGWLYLRDKRQAN